MLAKSSHMHPCQWVYSIIISISVKKRKYRRMVQFATMFVCLFVFKKANDWQLYLCTCSASPTDIYSKPNPSVWSGIYICSTYKKQSELITKQLIINHAKVSNIKGYIPCTKQSKLQVATADAVSIGVSPAGSCRGWRRTTGTLPAGSRPAVIHLVIDWNVGSDQRATSIRSDPLASPTLIRARQHRSCSPFH